MNFFCRLNRKSITLFNVTAVENEPDMEIEPAVKIELAVLIEPFNVTAVEIELPGIS